MLNNDYVENFRLFIRNRRVELKKTLEDIGREVGVSKTTVQRWESGNISNMRRDKIVKLAAALEVSPTELIGYEELPAAHVGDGSNLERFMAIFNQLSAEDQAKALSYAEYLLKDSGHN